MKHGWFQLVLGGSLMLFTGMAHGQAPGGRPPGGHPGGHGPGGPPGPGGFGGMNGANGGALGGSGHGTSNPPFRGSVTTSTGLKLGPPGRWWDDKALSSTIGLRREQQKKMDAIFNANKPAIIATYQTFEKEEANLKAVSSASQVDKSKTFAAIDAVNQARAALQKANTEMLLQIREQLDQGQIARLDALP